MIQLCPSNLTDCFIQDFVAVQ